MQKLFKFYSKGLSHIGGRGIKLNLTDEMKNKIYKAIFNKNELDIHEYELLFVGNCNFNNISNLCEKNNLVIFFKIQNDYYFYYGCYYKLVKDSFIKIKNKPITKFNKKKFKYSKNPIELNDINQNYDLCFCYNLLR